MPWPRERSSLTSGEIQEAGQGFNEVTIAGMLAWGKPG
jgi:hypothetical protein